MNISGLIHIGSHFGQEAKDYVDKMRRMSICKEDGIDRVYTMRDLFLKCELVILSANSNHIEKDLLDACKMRETIGRQNVIIACLVGSFTYDQETNSPSLTPIQPDLFWRGNIKDLPKLSSEDYFTR